MHTPAGQRCVFRPRTARSRLRYAMTGWVVRAPTAPGCWGSAIGWPLWMDSSGSRARAPGAPGAQPPFLQIDPAFGIAPAVTTRVPFPRTGIEHAVRAETGARPRVQLVKGCPFSPRSLAGLLSGPECRENDELYACEHRAGRRLREGTRGQAFARRRTDRREKRRSHA